MTLVVFKKINAEIHICGDMKMSWNPRVAEPPQIENWRVKVIIINKNIVIAWAGELEFAKDALKEIWDYQWVKKSPIDCKETKDIALRYHLISREQKKLKGVEVETDFIVSCADGISYKIADGSFYDITNVPLEYIGDREIYESFLSSSSNIDSPSLLGRTFFSFFRSGDAEESINSELSKIYYRMLNASDLYKLESRLGHVLTPVSGSPQMGFRYHLHGLVDAEYKTLDHDQNSKIVTLGDKQSENYAYQIMEGKQDGYKFVVFENLYSKKQYPFGDFSEHVPKLNITYNVLPTVEVSDSLLQ